MKAAGVAVALCLSSIPAHAAGVDCSTWQTTYSGLELFGITLGSDIKTISQRLIREDGGPRPRWLDGVSVNIDRLAGPSLNGMPIETILCDDGREMIVGMTTGGSLSEAGMFLGARIETVEEWAAAHEGDLRKSVRGTIHRAEDDRHVYVWGVKARLEAANEHGLSDYFILRRGCLKRVAPDSFATCPFSWWQAYQTRTKRVLD
jgi:hypothetical protein